MAPQQALSEQSGRLTDEEVSGLLHFTDVVRDPVQRDIRLTRLDRELIDTPVFQRLRGIKQLGLTALAYPGAVHNRFMHSLGTLSVAERMMRRCEFNYELYGPFAKGQPRPLLIPRYAHLLTRVCALLHDVAHVPFGHSLVKEGNVLPKDEWKDELRVRRLLSPGGEIGRAIETVFKNTGIADASTRVVAFLADVRGVLTADRSEVDRMEFPFINDLIGNTICADLIDYVSRDSFFSGLTESIGTRFLDYLAVLPLNIMPSDATHAAPYYVVDVKYAGDEAGPTRFAPIPEGAKGPASPVWTNRVVLLLYRYNERHDPVVKKDIISEAIDLVRRRFSVAEKLYFHKTKVAATAMLVSAAASAPTLVTAHDGVVGSPDELIGMSDEDFIDHLQAVQGRSATLAEKIRQRRLFKPIYQKRFIREETGRRDSKVLWRETYPRLRTLEGRREFEKRIEDLLDLRLGPSARSGTVAVYCPDRDMNLKAFEMLVLSEPEGERSEVTRLQDYKAEDVRGEMAVIKEKHERLWNLTVFVDPTVVDPSKPENEVTRMVAGVCASNLRLTNDLAKFETCGTISYADAWSQSLVNRFRSEHPNVWPGDAEELLGTAARDGPPMLYSEFEAAALKRFSERQKTN